MTQRIRIYVPLGADELAELERTRALPERARTGFAVTDRLRDASPGEDAEGLEYLATQDAATDAATHDLRVIAALDMNGEQVADPKNGEFPSAVTVSGAIPMQQLASFHVLDPAGERDVDIDFELSWYDATELALVRKALA